MRVNLTLPSETLILLSGTIHAHVQNDDRGPGLEIKLDAIPPSAMWIIESALSSLVKQTASQVAQMPSAPAAPSLEAGRAVPDAETQLITALVDELQSLSTLNPFQILGVGYDCDDKQVRKAFGYLTRKYHPDRFAQYQNPHVREYASELFILVRDSYRKLGNAQHRARTIAAIRNQKAIQRSQKQAIATPPPLPPQIPKQARAPTPASVPKPVPVNREPTNEITSESQRWFSEAANTEHSGPLELPKKSRRNPTLSEAERLLELGRYEEAQLHFARVAKRAPTNILAQAGVLVTDGLTALGRGDSFAAAQRFEAALEIDPQNERAARELAEMRRQATNERRSLLARLLRKEE